MTVDMLHPSRLVYLATMGIVVLAASGCRVPLMVFPAPEVCSGQRIEFVHAQTGEVIRDSGLLIVRRTYEIPVLTGIDAEPSDQVVDIRLGAARLPNKWALACVYVWWFYTVPVVDVYPGDNIEIVPVLPGYYVPFDKPLHNWISFYDRIKGGSLILRKNEEDPEAAMVYWQLVAASVGADSESLPDEMVVRFSGLAGNDRLRLKEYIDREVRQLRVAQQTTRPAGDPLPATKPG